MYLSRVLLTGYSTRYFRRSIVTEEDKNKKIEDKEEPVEIPDNKTIWDTGTLVVNKKE